MAQMGPAGDNMVGLSEQAGFSKCRDIHAKYVRPIQYPLNQPRLPQVENLIQARKFFRTYWGSSLPQVFQFAQG